MYCPFFVCTSGAYLVVNRWSVCLYGSLYLGVVASANTDLGHLLPLAFYFSLKWVKSLLDERAKFSCLVCDSLLAYLTHPPDIKCAEGQGGRLSTCCCWLMGFTESLLPPHHSVPPRAQPPGCVHLLCHDVKTVVLCARVAFIESFHFIRFAVFWPFFFSPSRLQTIFSRFDEALNSGNMALSPSHGQLIPIYLTLSSGFAVVLIGCLLYIWILCVLACAEACVWLHLIFLLCLVCCHKPLEEVLMGLMV